MLRSAAGRPVAGFAAAVRGCGLMKTKTSLPPFLPTTTLELGDQLLPGNLRKQPTRAKLGAAQFLEQVAEGASLDLGECLEGVRKRIRKRNVDTAFLAHEHVVATTPEAGKQKADADLNLVELHTQNAHKSAMNATNSMDKYEGKRRKIYISEWLHKALTELASLNRREHRAGRSFSEIMARAGTALLRRPENADRLRQAGILLPGAIFKKSAVRKPADAK